MVNRAAVFQALREQSGMSTPVRALLWIPGCWRRPTRADQRPGWVGRTLDSGHLVLATGRRADTMDSGARRRSVHHNSNIRRWCGPLGGVVVAADGGGPPRSVLTTLVGEGGRRAVCAPVNKIWLGSPSVNCHIRGTLRGCRNPTTMRNAIRHVRLQGVAQSGSCRTLRGSVYVNGGA